MVDSATESTPSPGLSGLLRSPAQFLAFGFGSGLSPWAPGTAGTLVAVALFLPLRELSLLHFSLFIVVTAALGIWICDAASKQLNTHDHPGIVWDEFVGYWITMWALPADGVWIVAGFIAFRFFDILKPWPISVLDRRVGGGLGIMIDDMLAGVLACLSLHAVLYFI